MKDKKKTFFVAVIIITAVIIIGVAVLIVFKQLNIASTENEYSNLSSSYASDIDTDEDSSPSATEFTSPSIDEQSVENPVDFSSLLEQNDEVYSWIYIPDTNINYPVCQSKTEDNFYLDHDVYKNYSYSGTIYSQSCNKTDYSDRVTVLYGHNMANGSMFSNLHKFADSSFFEQHDRFYVYTADRKLTYEIVSAFIYDDRHIMNSFDFSDDSVFQDYIDMLLNPRSVSKNVRSGVELSTDDKILTLSTCLNSGEGRYLVQGVLIKDEKTE